ncbi:MAG: zf-HC2 domain-containing protein [Gemmatimonadota bacterium]|nr:zf-HC2 domain-containing protein [Gemmatimonadota bacterium]
MSRHPEEQRLGAFVDDELAPADRTSVEAHLEGCERCREYVERIRALDQQLRALPREVAPPRDLRPATPERSSRRLFAPRAWAAAAAVLLAVLGAWIVAESPWSGPGAAPPSGTVAVVPGHPEPAATSPLAAYVSASRELAALYQRRRAELPEAAARSVDASLASLDRAIAQTSRAATRHPGAPIVRDMLTERYERKIELLRRTLEL